MLVGSCKIQSIVGYFYQLYEKSLYLFENEVWNSFKSYHELSSNLIIW